MVRLALAYLALFPFLRLDLLAELSRSRLGLFKGRGREFSSCFIPELAGILLSLGCRQGEPYVCFGIILRYALALEIAGAKEKLSICISLFRSFPIPLHCLGMVLGDALAIIVGHAKFYLGPGVPLICSLPEPRHRLRGGQDGNQPAHRASPPERGIHHEVRGPRCIWTDLSSVNASMLKRPNSRLAGYISATGSAGTIAAGDYLRTIAPHIRVVATEAMQCPTLFMNGWGAHRIEGIGEEVTARIVAGGARGFTSRESNHQGIIEANGTIHVALSNGLDLVIHFPKAAGDPGSEPQDETKSICEERV